MKEPFDLIKVLQRIVSVLRVLVFLVVILLGVTWAMTFSDVRVWLSSQAVSEVAVQEEQPEIVDDIHVATGLKAGTGLQLVIRNCTGCHSAKLVTQNRMDRKTWATTIKWMQQTQGLWDLGENTDIILDYLSEHYAPTKKGRRAQLTEVEWYELD